MRIWFEDGDSEIARIHKAAYEKSVKENRCVKVCAGSYYYKGYEISNDGGVECPWNWRKYTRLGLIAREENFPAETKRECMEQIDYDIEHKSAGLCDPA